MKRREETLESGWDNSEDETPLDSIMAGIDFLIIRSLAAPLSALRYIFTNQSAAITLSTPTRGAAAKPQKIRLSKGFVLMFLRTKVPIFSIPRPKCSLKL